MKVCLACGERINSFGWTCPNCSHAPKIIDDHLSFAPELAEISEGFESKFFSQLATLEANNFWFRSRNRLLIWTLKHYFPHAKNFLEIGCGTGFVLSGIEQAFPKLDICGSEIFSTGLSFASQRLSRADLFQMDARKIPFDNEFDVIGAFDVLEHIKEDTVVLDEMYRAVRNFGGIVITVPQHPWLWSQADEYTHHICRYRAKDLKHKVERSGFKVIKMTSFVSLLLPLMMISRWQQQQKPLSKYDSLDELKISGWLNVILECVLSLERRAIQSGISFPVGGSLMLIAKKI